MSKDTEYDDSGFDDLDNINFDEFDPDGAGSVNNRSVAEQARSAAIDGFKEFSTDTSNIERVADRAMPTGFKAIKEKGTTIYSGTASELRKAKKEIKGPFKEFKKSANSLVETMDGVLPDVVYKRLMKMTATTEDHDPEAERLSADDARVSQEVGGLVGALAELQKADANQKSASEAVRDGVANKQHVESVTATNIIRDRINRIIGFQDNITAVYQQKSLSLQFRQYFTQRDTLELLKRGFSDQITNLKGIVKNTGLPEVVKMQLSENWKQIAQEKLIGSGQESVQEWAMNFMPNTMNNVKNKIAEKRDNFINGLQSAQMMTDMVAGGITMQREMGGEFNPVTAGAGFAAKYGAGKLTDKITLEIKKQLAENESVMNISDRLLYLANSLPQFINRFVQEGGPESLSGGIADTVRDKLGWSVSSFGGIDATMNNNLERDATTVVGYDLMSRRALVEIIPEILELQLHEQRRFNNPSITDDDKTVYNTHREKYTTSKVRNEDVARSILPKNTRNSIRDRLEDAIQTIPDYEKMPLQIKTGLKRHLLYLARNNYRVDLEELLDYQRYDPDIPFELVDEIVSYLQDTVIGVDAHGKVDMEKPANSRLQLKLGMAGLKVGDAIPKIQPIVNKYQAVGRKSALRDTGFVTNKDGKGDVFNLEMFLEEILTGGQVKYKWDATDSKYETPKAPDYLRAPDNDAPIPPTITPYPYANFTPRNQPIINQPQADVNAVDKNPTAIQGFELPEQLLKQLSAITDSSRKANEFYLRFYDTGVDGYMGIQDKQLKALEAIQSNTASSSIIDQATFESIMAKLEQKTNGKVMSAIKKAGGFVWNGSGSILKSVWGLGAGVVTGTTGFIRDSFNGVRDRVTGVKVPDVISKLTGKVVMKSGDIRLQRYMDINTGKIIKSVDDITGPVRDLWKNVEVISLEDFKDGFVDTYGKPLLDKIASGAGWLAALPFRYMGNIGTGAMATYKYVKSFTKRALNPCIDIYVGEEKQARIKAYVMEQGGYVDEQGEVLYSPADLGGKVLLRGTDKVILDHDDYQLGLHDIEGNEIKTFKLRNLAMSVIKAPLRLAQWGVKKSMEFYTYAFDKLFGDGEKSSSFLHRIFGFFTKNVEVMKVEAKTVHINYNGKSTDTEDDEVRDDEVDTVTAEGAAKNSKSIVEAISEMKKAIIEKFTKKKVTGDTDGDGLREGSWQQKQKDRLDRTIQAGRDKRDELSRRYQESKKEKGGLGGLLSSAAGLFGRGAAGGAATAGTTATIAATGGLLASVGTPAAIAAVTAAVGAVGYGGYRFFRDRGDLEDLEALRFLLYGINTNDPLEFRKIRMLERELIDDVSIKDGKAVYTGKLQPLVVDMAPEFIGDNTDQGKVNTWIKWLRARFFPVFLHWVNTIHMINSGAEITDVDDDLSDEEKVSLLNNCKPNINGVNNPLEFRLSGFYGQICNTDLAMMDSIIAQLIQKFGGQNKHTSQKKTLLGKPGPEVNKTVAKHISLPDQATESYEIATAAVATRRAKGEQAVVTRDKNAAKALKKRLSMSTLQEIRLLSYGIGNITPSMLEAINALEELVEENFDYGWFGGVECELEMSEILIRVSKYFGITKINTPEGSEWAYWYVHRFMPVFSRMMLLIKDVASGNPLDSEDNLKPVFESNIANNAIVPYTDWKNQINPYKVGASPFINYQISIDEDGMMMAIRNVCSRLSQKKADGSKELGMTTGKIPKGLSTYSSIRQATVGTERVVTKEVVKDVDGSTRTNTVSAPRGGLKGSQPTTTRVDKASGSTPTKARPVAKEKDAPISIPSGGTPGAGFLRPVEGGRISSKYGTREHPVDKVMKGHAGLDIAVPIGRQVVATADGVVVVAGHLNGYGNAIYINHPKTKHQSRYAHLSKIMVKSGQQVRRGQLIALSGNTGKSTGPHLHFEIRDGMGTSRGTQGRPLNPLGLMKDATTKAQVKHNKVAAKNAETKPADMDVGVKPVATKAKTLGLPPAVEPTKLAPAVYANDKATDPGTVAPKKPKTRTEANKNATVTADLKPKVTSHKQLRPRLSKRTARQLLDDVKASENYERQQVKDSQRHIAEATNTAAGATVTTKVERTNTTRIEENNNTELRDQVRRKREEATKVAGRAAQDKFYNLDNTVFQRQLDVLTKIQTGVETLVNNSGKSFTAATDASKGAQDANATEVTGKSSKTAAKPVSRVKPGTAPVNWR